jgi:hypothetical protein
MPAGVKYCVACNLNLFDAFGDIEKNAPGVGRQNEIDGYTGLAGKTLLACLYLITFRWFRLARLFMD